MNVLFQWSDVALEANRKDHTGAMMAVDQRGPTRSSRALALVQIAVHDAVFSIIKPGTGDNPKGYKPYLQGAVRPTVAQTPANLALAVATAAYGVLKTLYPSQVGDFDAALTLSRMAAVGADPNAETVGVAIAADLLALRASDGADGSRPASRPPRNHPAAHQADPFNPDQGLHGARYGEADYFSLRAPLPLADAPLPGDSLYKRHYENVKRFGVLVGSKRKPDETLAGIYWAYDGASEIGTPPRLYNQIIRAILIKRNSSFVDQARLLALVNVAMADAGIEAWRHKYYNNLWRPVIGIRQHGPGLGLRATSGVQNIDKDADPYWQPLGAPRTNERKLAFTPPFPAYPSGHATFGAACFEVTRSFYGFATDKKDDVAFDFISDEMNGNSTDNDGAKRTRHIRSFRSLLEAMFENGLSRVYLGVHWQFDATTADDANDIVSTSDNIGGIPLGRAIAQKIIENFHQKNLGPPPPRNAPASAAIAATAGSPGMRAPWAVEGNDDTRVN